jgi:N-acetylmuramoyl-L-alanine amidase
MPRRSVRLLPLLVLTLLAGFAPARAAAPWADPVEIDRVSFAQRADGAGFVVRMHAAGAATPAVQMTRDARAMDVVLVGARLSPQFRRDEAMFPVRTYLVSPQRDRVVLHLTLADPMDAVVYRDGASPDLLLALTPVLRTAPVGWGGGRPAGNALPPRVAAARPPAARPAAPRPEAASRAAAPRPAYQAAPAPTAAPVAAPRTASPALADASPTSSVPRGPWPTRRSTVRTPRPAPAAPVATPPAPTPEPAATTRLTSVTAPSAANWQLDTIVLDAGHGGHDIGASYHGVREKDVTLGITRRLGRMLERELGVRVVYTRNDDRFIELRERGRIANRAGGKLFVSIHANAASNHSASGTETYFLAPHRSASARDVMERENGVIELESAPEHYAEFTEDGSDILRAMAMSAYQEESQELASLIEGQFRQASRRSRGVKQAGFLVLWAASMPSVLVETGFVSNADEARYLASEAGQDALARSVFNAISTYKERYERGLRVASGG